MKFILKIILIFLLPLNLFANEKTYSCKPIAAAVQIESGHIYYETLEDQDNESALLSAVPISNFSVRTDGVYYKNNPYREYEYLYTLQEALKKFDNIGIDKIEDDAQILDKTMGVENFRVFYLSYVNDDVSALKRISIDIQNNLTTEITLPKEIINGVALYYFLRSCDVKGVAVDFEPGFNKALG
ncbi:hypothetical protein N8726_01840 [Pelagibacteraceae bacterium]|nr:hypothetical protein [Pelagibacteraceae bacterium]